MLPYLHLHLHHMRMAAHLPTGIFLLHASKKINNAAKCFVSLKQNYSEGFIWAPYIFLALKRDQI